MSSGDDVSSGCLDRSAIRANEEVCLRPSYTTAGSIVLACLLLGCAGRSSSASDAGDPGAQVWTDGGSDAGRERPAFDAGTDPARNAVEPGAICTRVAQILCAGAASCCDDEVHDCERLRTDACVNDWHLDAISLDPTSGFDPAHAEAALAELERLAARCDTGFSAYLISTEGLRGSFRGSLPAGADCSPEVMVTQSQELVEQRAGAALTSCDSIETMACLPSEGTVLPREWTCAPRGDIGASCFSPLNCKDGLTCLESFFVGDSSNGYVWELGTCAEPLPTSSSCRVNGECASLYCIDGTCADAENVQAAYCFARQSEGIRQPTCLEQEPTVGDPCGPLDLGVCAYGERECRCVPGADSTSQVWACGTCPEALPTHLDTCDVLGMGCQFGDAICDCADPGSGSPVWNCTCRASTPTCYGCVALTSPCRVIADACLRNADCSGALPAFLGCLCDAQSAGLSTAPCVASLPEVGPLVSDLVSCMTIACAEECGLD